MSRVEPDREPVRFRAVLTGRGLAGPIEERLGRRLMRLVDPESAEGRALLEEGRVVLIGPEGSSLGSTSIEEARARLQRRLEQVLREPVAKGATPDHS